ncbi:MAG TPA: hypothetical protein VJ723_14150 [Candidatus Angelobacter sp.]|nr:hypothetical protein [Candidatus Angelobacter sp.]
MATCASCGCDLPGVEKLCRVCFDQQYRGLTGPKRNFWQWLGRHGPEFLFVIGVWIAGGLLYLVLARAPGLLRGTRVLLYVLFGGILWILTPWALVTEWKERRTLRALFVGFVFSVQAICTIIWWIKGTQIWVQINATILILMGIYSYAARAARFLRDW